MPRIDVSSPVKQTPVDAPINQIKRAQLKSSSDQFEMASPGAFDRFTRFVIDVVKLVISPFVWIVEKIRGSKQEEIPPPQQEPAGEESSITELPEAPAGESSQQPKPTPVIVLPPAPKVVDLSDSETAKEETVSMYQPQSVPPVSVLRPKIGTFKIVPKSKPAPAPAVIALPAPEPKAEEPKPAPAVIALPAPEPKAEEPKPAPAVIALPAPEPKKEEPKPAPAVIALPAPEPKAEEPKPAPINIHPPMPPVVQPPQPQPAPAPINIHPPIPTPEKVPTPKKAEKPPEVTEREKWLTPAFRGFFRGVIRPNYPLALYDLTFSKDLKARNQDLFTKALTMQFPIHSRQQAHDLINWLEEDYEKYISDSEMGYFTSRLRVICQNWFRDYESADSEEVEEEIEEIQPVKQRAPKETKLWNPLSSFFNWLRPKAATTLDAQSGAIQVYKPLIERLGLPTIDLSKAFSPAPVQKAPEPKPKVEIVEGPESDIVRATKELNAAELFEFMREQLDESDPFALPVEVREARMNLESVLKQRGGQNPPTVGQFTRSKSEAFALALAHGTGQTITAQDLARWRMRLEHATAEHERLDQEYRSKPRFIHLNPEDAKMLKQVNDLAIEKEKLKNSLNVRTNIRSDFNHEAKLWNNPVEITNEGMPRGTAAWAEFRWEGVTYYAPVFP